MKKLFSVLLVFVFALSACGKAPVADQTGTDKNAPAAKQAENKSVWSSIRDAVDKAITLECEYTDSEEGIKSTVFIKGKSVRLKVDPTEDQPYTEMLMKNDKIWMWDPATKKGIFMDSSVKQGFEEGLEDLSDAIEENTEADETDELIGEIEENGNCKTSLVPDSYFDEPTGIEFMDFATAMQNWANSFGGQMEE